MNISFNISLSSGPNFWTSAYFPISLSQMVSFRLSEMWGQACQAKENRKVDSTISIISKDLHLRGNWNLLSLWQRVCYQGQSASSQEYVCYFINMSSEKARLEDSALACVYTWLHWKKCLRNKVSTIWGNCFEDDVKVERCLNSAEGGPWVTLLSIVFFLVNKTWHG